MTTPASENCPIQTCPWCHKPFTGNCCDAGCLLAQRDTLTAEVARLKTELRLRTCEAVSKANRDEELRTAYAESQADNARLRAALESISRYEGDDTHYLKQIAAAALWRGRSVSDAT